MEIISARKTQELNEFFEMIKTSAKLMSLHKKLKVRVIFGPCGLYNCFDMLISHKKLKVAVIFYNCCYMLSLHKKLR